MGFSLRALTVTSVPAGAPTSSAPSTQVAVEAGSGGSGGGGGGGVRPSQGSAMGTLDRLSVRTELGRGHRARRDRSTGEEGRRMYAVHWQEVSLFCLLT